MDWKVSSKPELREVGDLQDEEIEARQLLPQSPADGELLLRWLMPHIRIAAYRMHGGSKYRSELRSAGDWRVWLLINRKRENRKGGELPDDSLYNSPEIIVRCIDLATLEMRRYLRFIRSKPPSQKHPGRNIASRTDYIRSLKQGEPSIYDLPAPQTPEEVERQTNELHEFMLRLIDRADVGQQKKDRWRQLTWLCRSGDKSKDIALELGVSKSLIKQDKQELDNLFCQLCGLQCQIPKVFSADEETFSSNACPPPRFQLPSYRGTEPLRVLSAG